MFIVGFLLLSAVICVLVLISQQGMVAYGEAKSDLKWLDAIEVRKGTGREIARAAGIADYPTQKSCEAIGYQLMAELVEDVTGEFPDD